MSRYLLRPSQLPIFKTTPPLLTLCVHRLTPIYQQYNHSFSTATPNMTRVLLTGGSGFIAAHVLDILLQHGHSVVTTVRSQEKANKIKEAHSKYGKDKLDFAIVEDIAQEGAFDKAVVSDPPFEAVIHTASPFHFNVTDVQKVCQSQDLLNATTKLT